MFCFGQSNSRVSEDLTEGEIQNHRILASKCQTNRTRPAGMNASLDVLDAQTQLKFTKYEKTHCHHLWFILKLLHFIINVMIA